MSRSTRAGPSSSASFDAARVRAILFDLDGTLLALRGGAPGAPLARRLRWAAPLLPGQDPQAFVRRLFVLTETPVNYALAALDRLGLDTWLTPVADLARRAKGIGTSTSSEMILGADRALSALGEQYLLAVLTNRGRLQAHRLLAHHQIEALFATVTTRGDLWRFKPHPEAVRRTAAKLQLAPTTILMVGDLPVDMLTARRAGAQAVGVLTGFATEEELWQAGATAVLPSVAELPDLLREGTAKC